jgi:hypothetical protein
MTLAKNWAILLVFLTILSCFSCKKSTFKEISSENDLFEIYTAMKLYSGKKAEKVFKKYGLNDDFRLKMFYSKLEELSTNEAKWAAFQERFNQERQRYAPNRINR